MPNDEVRALRIAIQNDLRRLLTVSGRTSKIGIPIASCQNSQALSDCHIRSMDIMYHAVRLAINDKLFYAPLEVPTAVLDVGTGTGEAESRM